MKTLIFLLLCSFSTPCLAGSVGQCQEAGTNLISAQLERSNIETNITYSHVLHIGGMMALGACAVGLGVGSLFLFYPLGVISCLTFLAVPTLAAFYLFNIIELNNQKLLKEYEIKNLEISMNIKCNNYYQRY